jgi:hypothetical protein
MTKAWEVPPYTCPKCGAKDSTCCDFLMPGDVTFGYPKNKSDEARKAGCRIMYYHDLAVEDRMS